MPDIIIVEDNREIGTLLCDFLRKENYTVSLVDTGEKALQIFEQYGANLVVIDIGLPGVDGYSVCSKIRETSNAHIMIATARDDKESTLKGLQIGADDYICKPYDIDILIAKDQRHFQTKICIGRNRMRQSEIEQCHADTHREPNTGQCHGKGIPAAETAGRK